ncbi:MAG: LacI family DNA-binding transcriptional regulator [Verrucomicrobia bacterium]|nr:LacI family DNA-binding transcriptional regulator [Verrucomicrobiota bacterium]MCH8513095.1 LacI family transcriptional regulator [Kiritimatiellia bacterium]
MRVTLKSIADKAGVSVSTVSLALRNDPRIKESRRNEINALAREMGYTPNPLLSSLASRQFRHSETFEGLGIAYLTYLPNLGSKANANFPYVTAYMDGAAPRAKELGYRVEHFELSAQKSLPALGRMLYQRGFAGVILGPVRELKVELDFPWETFCVVACGGVEPHLARRFHWVKTDFFGVTRRACQRAWDAGYRNIAVVLAEQTGEIEETDHRLGAVLTTGQRMNPEKKVPVFTYKQTTPRDQIPALKKKFLTFVKKHHPDIVIGYSLEFYYALIEDGFRVPEDIAYISLHIRPNDTWYDPLSGYCINQMKIGRAAVDQVDAQIHYGIRGPVDEPRTILLMPDWLERESFAPKLATAKSKD